MSEANAITLQRTGVRLLYTATDTSAASAAATAGDGDGTVAMFSVVIDPNSWRGRASHQPSTISVHSSSSSQRVSSTKE